MVHVTGPIGVGKSTLVNALGERLHLQVLRESGSDNPYLDRFYADARTWAYQCQRWFHEEALEQAYTAELWEQREVYVGFIWDSPPSTRHDIFIPPLQTLGAISESEATTLSDMRHHANAVAPPPLLVVALHADAAQLRERVVARDRECERGIAEGSFLDAHVAHYREWWDRQPQATLLELDAAQAPAELADKIVDAFTAAVLAQGTS
jgi:deoxyadenosine/deoxycytidine kinase